MNRRFFSKLSSVLVASAALLLVVLVIPTSLKAWSNEIAGIRANSSPAFVSSVPFSHPVAQSIAPSAAISALQTTEAISHNVDFVGQIGGTLNGVAVQGSYAYVGVGNSLLVLDISAPNHPTVVGQTRPMPDAVNKVAVSGTLAYVADSFGGLRLVDVSDPTNPLELGAWSGTALCVAVAGSYAYVGEGAGMHVIDVSNPASPQHIGFINTIKGVFGLAVAGHYAYVGAARNVGDYHVGLWVIDVSDPAHPQAAGHVPDVRPFEVTEAGNYAYAADDVGLRIIDISNPAYPILVSSFHTQGYGRGVSVANGHAYLADIYGLSIIDISEPITPTQTGYYSTTGECWNVAVSGNTAYVAAEFDGLHILNVSDPANPREAGFYEVPVVSPSSVAVDGPFAYVADGDTPDTARGLRILDVSNPARPAEIGAYRTPGQARDVAVASPYVYIADGDRGLRVISAFSLINPVEISSVEGIDARAVAVSGNYAYVVGSSGLHIIKIKDPANPVEIGSYVTPGSAQGVAVAGNYAYVADGMGGLRIINVANPHLPTEVGVYTTTENVQDVAVAGSYAYIPDGDGLHIINVSDPAHLTEAGYCQMSASRVAVTAEGYAYVVDDKLHVVDVSNPMQPVEVGYHEMPSGSRNIAAIDGGYAYIASEAGLLIMRYHPSSPTADFIASPTSGLRPLTVTFTDTSIGGADTWLWTFGDGGISTQPNPTHTYTAASVYTVSLRVSNSFGSNTLTQASYITVTGPWARFVAAPTVGMSPLTVTFTNQSSDYTFNLWDFGDGNTSTLDSPTHIYTALGAYTVSLMVGGPDGDDTETKPDYIAVVEPKAYLPLVLSQSP